MSDHSTILESKKIDSGSEWLSISDMMTGLMVIFLFIAISYMINVQKQNEQMTQIAETYFSLNQSLYQDLLEEFEDDLPRWSARLDSSSLAIRFTEPDILFEAGSDVLKDRFRAILSDFFPRYVDILMKPEYKDDIAEVRIEGHTSSEWIGLDWDNAYFENMDLSQRRTRQVLHYVMFITEDRSIQEWLVERFTANGLSSSKLIWIDKENRIEDKEQSRRVEFRVKTDSEKKINEIISVGA